MLDRFHFRSVRALASSFTALFLGARALSAEQATFTSSDLKGWRNKGEWMTAKAVSLDPADPEKFVITPGNGIFVNGPKQKSTNPVTEREFGDVEVHVEFCIAKHSNSGVYLMGRYEIQVYDSYGVEKDKYPGIECGGIYGRWINEKNVEGHSPNVNASRPAGEWQSFDITFRAPRFDAAGKKIANAKMVKVVHNGKVIHENVELTGPTRSPMADNEKPTGPLRLQGDHGPVAYRNITIREVKLP